jgi:hypothetical protein
MDLRNLMIMKNDLAKANVNDNLLEWVKTHFN